MNFVAFFCHGKGLQGLGRQGELLGWDVLGGISKCDTLTVQLMNSGLDFEGSKFFERSNPMLYFFCSNDQIIPNFLY